MTAQLSLPQFGIGLLYTFCAVVSGNVEVGAHLAAAKQALADGDDVGAAIAYDKAIALQERVHLVLPIYLALWEPLTALTTLTEGAST